MTESRRKIWMPLVVLAVLLAIWAGIFALGAFLELGADQPHRDPRKALIIVGTMAAFLAFWGWMLWMRSRRRR